MMNKPAFQYLASILSVIAVALMSYLVLGFIGYTAVALVLLVMVSILALLFDIWPVLLAALLSALILNFFFIPPLFTFHINAPEDVLMFLMYFLVAMVHTVLTNKIKAQEKKVRDREDKENTIRLYNTLLNSLSHELKTPISTIIAATDTLLEKEVSLSPENKSTLLTEIESAGHRLNRQVENLLNMSRLESGMLKVKKDWCDMDELIHLVIQKIDPDAQKRIDYKVARALPLFKMDMGLMEQVVYNLLHNALQYTPVDQLVRVRVTHNEEHCIITISDQGPGFPEEAIAHIFDKFYRLPDSKTGGTGLGLSIAKGFTEAHGGQLTVKNMEKSGAVFTVSVPAETSFLKYIKHE